MMRRWFLVLICILSLGTTFAAGASFEEQLAQAPKCAVTYPTHTEDWRKANGDQLTCALNLVSTTSCSLTNATCLCNNVEFVDAVGQCVLANCTVREALETQNLIAGACGRLVRTQEPIILGIAIAFLVPSLAVCLIRLVIRAKAIGWFGMDDIFIFLAVALTIPTTAAVVVRKCTRTCTMTFLLTLKVVQAGLGRDLWGVDVDNIDKIFYVSTCALITPTKQLTYSSGTSSQSFVTYAQHP